MAPQADSLTCSRCSQRFKQKSSLVRHSKRCSSGFKPLPRQKACSNCSSSKARCDLQHPTCGRCQTRSLACGFAAHHDDDVPRSTVQDACTAAGDASQEQAVELSSLYEGDGYTSDSTPITFHDVSSAHDPSTSSTPPTIHRGTHQTPEGSIGVSIQDFTPKLAVSASRRQAILGNSPRSPQSSVLVKHTAHLVIRVLKSWPLLMAMHDPDQLPSIIHKIQLADEIPNPLANCYTLIKMWACGIDGSRDLVQNTILQEVQRLLREFPSYDEKNLLAATQSLVILSITLFFSMGETYRLTHPSEAEIIVAMWDVKHRLATTGLFLGQELAHRRPTWEQWATVSAKRRTILSMHHLEWAWSVLRGYPTLTCFELGPLPAPAARHLWREADESKWENLYDEWLRLWKNGGYKMAEFFEINPGGDLDIRSEMWLAEADEYGMLLMAEVNAISDEDELAFMQ